MMEKVVAAQAPPLQGARQQAALLQIGARHRLAAARKRRRLRKWRLITAAMTGMS